MQESEDQQAGLSKLSGTLQLCCHTQELQRKEAEARALVTELQGQLATQRNAADNERSRSKTTEELQARCWPELHATAAASPGSAAAAALQASLDGRDKHQDSCAGSSQS